MGTAGSYTLGFVLPRSGFVQQPDEANTITRTLFVGIAMVESTGIYCLVIAMIVLFANPFWNHMVSKMGG